MRLNLEGRAAILTGASKGIGAATARLLSAEGASVLLVARGAEGVERAAADCDGETATLALDVTSADAAKRVVSTCLDRFGRLDVLVNNAGFLRLAPPDEQSDEYWWHQLKLNVMAPMRLMRAAAPHMAEAGWGRIVNVCSTGSKVPEVINVAYCASKAALLSLSRASAVEWGERGVLVNAVLPGVIDTPMWLGEDGIADRLAAAEGTDREQVLAAAGREALTGRRGTSEEVAAVIGFLCSDLASNVAGAAWSVDGGAVPTMY